MPRLLAQYINQDIGYNYDGDVVKYLRELACYASVEKFREAVFAIPGKVEKHFEEILLLDRYQGSKGRVQAVLLARSLTHAGTKRKVQQHFEKNSVPVLALHEVDQRRIVNSPAMCEYVNYDHIFSMASIRDMFTRNTDIRCMTHFVDSASKRNKSIELYRIATSLTSIKPSLISEFTERRLRAIADEDRVLQIIAAWDNRKTIRYIIDKHITLAREAINYIGEIISMRQIANEHVAPSAIRMYRLLGA